jgi:hypothetical protein
MDRDGSIPRSSEGCSCQAGMARSAVNLFSIIDAGRTTAARKSAEMGG